MMTKVTNTDLERDRGFSNPHSQAWTMARKEGSMEKEADVQADAWGGDKIWQVHGIIRSSKIIALWRSTVYLAWAKG